MVMNRAFVRVTLLLAMANVTLTIVVLWGLSAIGPSSARPPGTGASMATQRLADAYANDAFRYVITHDYAALNVVIRQTASWPELVYLSVEDAQGRILAHSDPARVGQVWSAELARSIRATVKVAYDDVVAIIADPSNDPRTRAAIGRVRLGFISDASVPALPTPPPPPWVALLTAIALAVPMAMLVTRLGSRPAAEAEPEQVTRLLRDLKETANEAQRLQSEQTRNAEEMARLQRERASLADEALRAEQQAEGERAAAAAAAERGREEAEALRRELGRRAAEAASLRMELDRERQSQGSTALAPPSGPPLEDRLGDGEADAARQAQYRAVGHICQVFRHSLTTILGFSRLLLRNVDGGLNAHQRTDVENIHRAGDELLAFITALSELARADLGSLPCRRETVSLGRLLAQAAQMPDVAAGVKVVLDAEDTTFVEADPAHVGRALHLLLQYTVTDAQPGSVVATARAHGGSASVEVAYPRPPVPPEDLDRLFSPFGPAGATDAARIRLALARALTALNGGQLSVEPGDRSVTFSLTLPQDGGRAPDPPGEPADRTQETAQR